MKAPKKRTRQRDMVALATKALREAVAEVYAEAARDGESLPIWDRNKKKVVWVVPKQKPRRIGRSPRPRANGSK